MTADTNGATATTTVAPAAPRHTAAMDAHEFWASFVRPVVWDKPKVVTGTLVVFDAVEDDEALAVTLPDGREVRVPRTHPRVILQNKHGRFGRIDATPTQLYAGLVNAEPNPGDTVTIDYQGEKPGGARPRRNPTKRFEVTVTRAAG